MTDPIRAYVNGRGVDVPPGAPALVAVRAFDPDVATQVAAGERSLADSRGLPLDPASPLEAGTIIRVVSARRREADA